MRYPALAACLLAASILTTSGAEAEETYVMTGVYTATEEASTADRSPALAARSATAAR